MQVRRIPFRGSATLGRGVNLTTGEIVGKALEVLTTETATSGGEAFYEVQIVESHESLMESLGLSVQASGRYGLFSAEGKFALSEKSSFNSQSSFVVASCRVQNAFQIIDRVKLLPEAEPLRETPDRFKTAFGTGFVRGLQSGGEFYAVLRVTSTSSGVQSSLAAAFKADCQGLMGSGSFETAYSQAMQSTSSSTEVSITMYQRAGQDEQLSLTQDAPAIIQRLKDFPRIAREHPCGYEAEVAEYSTLALPEVNDEEVADRELALQDCARLRLKYMTRRNDIDFARENRAYFEELPADAALAEMWEAYGRAVTLVQLHAQKVAGRRSPPTVFDLRAADPALLLPVFAFKRKDIPRDIPVPRLVGMPVDKAKQELALLGLGHDSDSVAIDADSTASVNTVTKQYPPDGQMAAPGTKIRISYNYKPDERFLWRIRAVGERVVISPHVSG